MKPGVSNKKSAVPDENNKKSAEKKHKIYCAKQVVPVKKEADSNGNIESL